MNIPEDAPLLGRVATAIPGGGWLAKCADKDNPERSVHIPVIAWVVTETPELVGLIVNPDGETIVAHLATNFQEYRPPYCNGGDLLDLSG